MRSFCFKKICFAAFLLSSPLLSAESPTKLTAPLQPPILSPPAKTSSSSDSFLLPTEEQLPRLKVPAELSKKASAVSEQQKTLMIHTIEQQLEAFREKDASKAYYAETSIEFQKSVPIKTFQHFVKVHPLLTTQTGIKIDAFNFNGIVGVIKGRLITSEKEPVRVEYHMIQENGVWKIRRFELLKSSTSIK